MMQIHPEIVAALVGVWIALQLSMLRSIGKLETEIAVHKEKIHALESKIPDSAWALKSQGKRHL